MKSTAPWAAAFLALAFGFITYVAVAVEPGMGFTDVPADFLDPEKVMAGYTTAVWRVEGVLYLLIPVALILVARGSRTPVTYGSGVLAALLFFLVAVTDRVGAQIPVLYADTEAQRAVLAALLPVRLVFLKCAVVGIGFFAFRTTREKWGSGAGGMLWNALGYIVLIFSIAFLYAFVPAPLAFVVWAAALTAKWVRSAPAS